MAETYTVSMSVKTPSLAVQYRMLEAGVSVTGENADDVIEQAEAQLVKALARVCNALGEPPPDEIYPKLISIYGAKTAAEIYGEELLDNG